MATAMRGIPCDADGDTDMDLGSLFQQVEKLLGGPVEPLRGRAVSSHPGSHFGDFVRVELLGNGGMGEVWKAWDRKLRRWVALKFPKCESQADLEQLKEEAASAGLLSHPNVATVYGAGQA